VIRQKVIAQSRTKKKGKIDKGISESSDENNSKDKTAKISFDSDESKN